MQSTGQTSTQARSFTPMQASVITYVMRQYPRAALSFEKVSAPDRATA
jgi:hypothetical protein